MNIWLALAFSFAAPEVVTIARPLPRLGFIAKPDLMVCAFLWLYSQ